MATASKKITVMPANDRLQKILQGFAKGKDHPELAEQLGKKAWKLILNFRIEQLVAPTASQAVKNRIIAETTATALSWDTDDASLSTTQKIFNRLAAGRYVEAVKLCESSIAIKASAAKSAVKDNSINSANKKHEKNNAVIKKAMKYYQENQSLYKGYGGKKKAAYDLEAKFPPIKATTYSQHLKKYS